MNTDHVVARSPLSMFCQHCSLAISTHPGATLERVADSIRGFALMHRRCEPVPVPSPQLPLPHTEPRHRVDVVAPTLAELEAEDDRKCELCGVVAEDIMSHRCAGIDGSSDEPDPETDPPHPDPYAMFHMNYPKASNHLELWDALRLALTAAEYELVDGDTVAAWHKSSGQFEAVAHWARVENAHNSAGKRPPTPGLTIPQRFSMPHALAHALAVSPPLPPKAPRKKATTRKAKP